MSKIISVGDNKFQIEESDLDFEYQKKLTPELDAYNDEFDQDFINKIVLWKVNRYAQLPASILRKINQVDSDSNELNEKFTTDLLQELLKVNGVGVPMASTILRFKNSNVYQIIDQRVYRVLYPGEILKFSAYLTEKRIEEYAVLYIKYLKDLRDACNELSIPFQRADRILYNADKRLNKAVNLSNY